jgi:hypothetical protein
VRDVDNNSNIIDVPHGDVLTALAVALGRWQAEVRRLDADLAGLRGGLGVYLDQGGAAVMPGWYERKKDGRHVAWYLIWPHKHARRTGCKRRQYVRAAEVEATRSKAARTGEYRDLAARRARLEGRIAEMGRGLAGLVEEHGLVTKTARLAGESVTTQPDDEMATRTASLSDESVTTLADDGLATGDGARARALISTGRVE